MPRIVGVDIPKEKKIYVSLCYIYGIGQPTARKISGSGLPSSHGNLACTRASGVGVYASLHLGHSRRARRWARTASSAEPTRNGSIPISVRRVMAEGASFVCRVESTR